MSQAAVNTQVQVCERVSTPGQTPECRTRSQGKWTRPFLTRLLFPDPYPQAALLSIPPGRARGLPHPLQHPTPTAVPRGGVQWHLFVAVTCYFPGQFCCVWHLLITMFFIVEKFQTFCVIHFSFCLWFWSFVTVSFYTPSVMASAPRNGSLRVTLLIFRGFQSNGTYTQVHKLPISPKPSLPWVLT